MEMQEVFLVFLIMTRAISGQILEQPNLVTVHVPLHDQVTLTCSAEEGYIIDWRIRFPNNVEVDASNGNFETALMQRGFTLEGVATNRSTLSLRETETQTNNETNITCLAREAGTSTAPVPGNTVTVIFYDAPPPPTDLGVAKNELGYPYISWSLGFIEGVLVNYTLTVLNLNTTSAQPIIIAGLLDQDYVFETSRSCDVYSFTVTAVTAAGNSTPSQELTYKSCDEVTTTSLHQLMTTIIVSTPPSQTKNTTSPASQDVPTLTLIIIVSIVVTVLMTILVLVNVMVCVYCHFNKTKKEEKAASAVVAEPLYETPGETMSLPPAKNAVLPFVMTSSSAYGVTIHKSSKTAC